MADRKAVIGLVINPIAGMGGKVALKGTDGKETLDKARERGARPESLKKAERALEKLRPYSGQLQLLTVSGTMGAALCEKMGFSYTIVYESREETTEHDTVAAAEIMTEKGVDLLLFAGGDGTARNICQAVGERVPVLGIPAGVKIQSAVFGLTPEAAGAMAAMVAQGLPVSMSEREVVDLNEDEYRKGRVSSKLYGSLRVPYEPSYVQNMKQSGFSSENDQMGGIAAYLEEKMEDDIFYAIGSGSTAKCISRRLGIDYELLGVDLVRNKKLVKKDMTEEELWEIASGNPVRIIVSPIGGQGFIFGRGNHQFSARILKVVGKENIQVIAPESKLISIPGHTLHVDCGDEYVEKSLNGYYNVLCGYGYFHSFRCK